MKQKSTVIEKSDSTVTSPTNRLESISTNVNRVAPAGTKHENGGHRLTKNGIAFDQPDVTAAPNMTKPIVPPVQHKKTDQVSASRPIGAPGSRSHEFQSLVGTTTRLKLKKTHVVQSVAYISNKGGVGKTHMSSNMAFNLARMGKKVLLIDLDLGNSDVTNKLGFYCENTIVDLLEGKRDLGQLTYNTPHGFDIIGGESGNIRLANLTATQKKRFIKALREMGSDYDYVLYDLSAGINSTVLDFALAQDYQIVVTTPQDIVAGYSCIKAVYQRFQELETKMAGRDPKYKMHTTLRPFVVLNQVPDFKSGKELYQRLLNVAQQCIPANKTFFLKFHFLGVVTSDQTKVRTAELDRYLYSSQHGASRTGQCYNFLVENLVKYEDPNKPNFTTKLKRFVDIFMRSVEETKYAK